LATRKHDPAKSEARFYVILAIVVTFIAVMYYDSKTGAHELQKAVDDNRITLNADIPKGPAAREEDWEAYRKEEQRLDDQLKVSAKMSPTHDMRFSLQWG
jgi:cell division protein FtsN